MSMPQKITNYKQALGVPGEFYDTTSPRRVSAFILNGRTGASVYASNVITFADNPVDGDTLTVGATTYKFVDALAADNDVQIGLDVPETLSRLIKVVNGTGTAGVDYFAGTTTPNASARAEMDGAIGVRLVALTAGTGGNSTALTATGGAIIVETGAALLGGAAGVFIPPTVARVFSQNTDIDNTFQLGGQGAMRGVLVSPKQYANTAGLDASYEVPEGSAGDIAWMGNIVVKSAQAVAPGYVGIYNTTTGEIGANPTSANIPNGWALMGDSRYILHNAAAGGLAVLELDL